MYSSGINLYYQVCSHHTAKIIDKSEGNASRYVYIYYLQCIFVFFYNMVLANNVHYTKTCNNNNNNNNINNNNNMCSILTKGSTCRNIPKP